MKQWAEVMEAGNKVAQIDLMPGGEISSSIRRPFSVAMQGIPADMY